MTTEKTILCCSICLENIDKVNESNKLCGHIFHTECINSWLNTHNTCPLCRTKIVNDSTNIYNSNINNSTDMFAGQGNLRYTN